MDWIRNGALSKVCVIDVSYWWWAYLWHQRMKFGYACLSQYWVPTENCTEIWLNIQVACCLAVHQDRSGGSGLNQSCLLWIKLCSRTMTSVVCTITTKRVIFSYRLGKYGRNWNCSLDMPSWPYHKNYWSPNVNDHLRCIYVSTPLQ